MTNKNYEIIEKAEKEAAEPYDKILAEYEKVANVMHEARRNLNHIASDLVHKMEDTEENHIIYTAINNANQVVTNNSNIHDMTNLVREIGYNMKVKARVKARLDMVDDVGKNAREWIEKTDPKRL